MKVFVSEFVCGGGWPEERIEPSLAREGRAMWLALVEDLARVSDVKVVTTWDARLGECPIRHGEVLPVDSSEREAEEFRRLVQISDVVWVIAPETDGILERRQAAAGSRVLGGSDSVIRHCADKWQTARLLQEHGIATPETRLFDPRMDQPAWPWPMVIKPRDGAGSLNTFLIRDEARWGEIRHQLAQIAPTVSFIQQPYFSGRALSVALLIRPDGSIADILPVAEQRLSDDGRFRYLGGRIPADISDEAARRVSELAVRACRAVPGLSGYVGCDIVLPDDPRAEPLLIEINSRLTSSYLGYRQLTDQNIPARLLGFAVEPLRWKKNAVEFDMFV